MEKKSASLVILGHDPSTRGFTSVEVIENSPDATETGELPLALQRLAEQVLLLFAEEEPY